MQTMTSFDRPGRDGHLKKPSLKDAALSDPTQLQPLGFAMLELLGE
jgi:hypothetical protein